VRVVRGTNQGSYRVLVLSAQQAEPADHGEPAATNVERMTVEDGWELVRSRVTKDGISRLFVYRKSA